MAAKKRLRYEGPYRSVDVVDPEGTRHVVAHGETKDFPAEVAGSLLEQGEDWSEAGKGKAKSNGGDD